MIFFILIIFRWLYFIIQFGKSLNYSSLLVQGIVIGCSFTLARKGYDNHYYHNKPPDSWSKEGVMPGRDGPENLRILKKSQLEFEIRPYGRESRVPAIDMTVGFGLLKM